jgi:hypothetical protein
VLSNPAPRAVVLSYKLVVKVIALLPTQSALTVILSAVEGSRTASRQRSGYRFCRLESWAALFFTLFSQEPHRHPLNEVFTALRLIQNFQLQ